MVARKSSSTGLILSSDGFVHSYDTIEERLVPTKTKLFNITSMDFEPIGDQLYFSDSTGVAIFHDLISVKVCSYCCSFADLSNHFEF